MPRIRTLKPEALLHRKVGRLSDRAFRLWVTMLLQADDEGRLVADPGQLRAVGFGLQERTRDVDIRRALDELSSSGLIRLYESSATHYADFPSWLDHQRIDRPTPSKLPPYDSSTTAPRILDDSSTSPRSGSEGIGSEGIGSEGKGGESEGRDQDAGEDPLRPPDGFGGWPQDWNAIQTRIQTLPFLDRYQAWLTDLDWWKTQDEKFEAVPATLDQLLCGAVAYITSTRYKPRTRVGLLKKLHNCLEVEARKAEREAQAREG